MRKGVVATGKWRVASLGKHLLLIGLSFVAIFPLYWMLNTSFKPGGEVFSSALLPSTWTFDNYKVAWSAIPLANMLTNSLIVTLAQTALQLLTSILAAYAFTRWDFRGSGFIFVLISLTWLVPFQVIMIPNYVTITDMGLRNSLLGLIVPNIASAFAVLQLFHAFKAFPSALIEAARLDGASNWAILWRIVFPNMRASVASIGVLLFITCWNEYFWPLLLTSRLEDATIQIGLQMFMSSETNLWGPLMAAAAITSLPILLVYLLMQRQIIDSFVKGGLR